MMSPDSAKWLEAMKSEMGSMYENKVQTLVDLPDDRQAIENKWIFKRKTDADSSVTIYKARIVAEGLQQVQGVDYDESFSLVSMLKSVRIMLAIATFYEIWQKDVKTAFLNGFLKEELYMMQPEGFDNPKGANKLWTLVDLPDGWQAILNKWISKRKTGTDSSVTICKARLIAKGFSTSSRC